MAKQIKVRFGQGEVVLSKSTKIVGVRKTKTRSLMAESELDPEIKNLVHPSLGGFEVVTVNKTKSRSIDDTKTMMRAMGEVETVTNVYHVPGSTKPLVPTGSIYVQFIKNITDEQEDAILAELGLALKERRGDGKLVAQCTPQSRNPVTAAMQLAEKKEVRWAEPDMDAPVDHYAFAAPPAKLFGQMWHLQNSGRIPDNPNIRIKAGADSKVVEAWKLLDGYGNPNIVIAVIDNGFDTTHPDLNAKIVRPWDLWDGSPNLRMGDPTFTHGTPCAGVAIAPASGGMCGSAPVARFMPISGTGFSIESTEAMFNYCIRNGADIVSCSWGTVENGYQLSSDKMAAISRAAREGRGGRGCVICYAAGNEGVDYLNFYAQHPDVICVGASTSEDDHADYSNTGPQLDVVAPSNGGYYPIVSARAYWDEGVPGEVGASKY
jgi:subtilisin family serine protease